MKKTKKEIIPGDITRVVANRDNDLSNRRGYVVFETRFIKESSENTLREIFSNFFPIDIERTHSFIFFDRTNYYGVSPHFERLELGVVIPEYMLTLDIDEEGVFTFNNFKKVEPSVANHEHLSDQIETIINRKSLITNRKS